MRFRSSPSAFVPGIPKGMDDIVMHAMSANISRRYESAEKMYEDMEVLRSDPNARFHYVASEGQLGRDARSSARTFSARRAAVRQSMKPLPLRAQLRRAPARARRPSPAPAPVSAKKSRMSRTAFLKSLAERPGMAVGMAVGVIAVISLLLVGILMLTGSSDKSEKELSCPASSGAISTKYWPTRI